MSWFLRFAGWASVLAPLGWLASHRWQVLLAGAVNHVLALFGHPTDFGRVDVGAPLDIGLFVALCLASRRAPVRERIRALLIGVPGMVVVEVVFASLAIGMMVARGSRALDTDPVMRAGFLLTDTIPWVSGAVLWVILLGGWELPAPGGSPRPHSPRA
jgi:hypothetical protein